MIKQKLKVDRQGRPKILFSGALLAVLLLASAAAAVGPSKTYSRLFKVTPQSSMLSISIPSGSIKVKPWEKAEIKVSATLLENTLEISERQVRDHIQIQVHCRKVGQAHFEAFVPASCTLDLKCLNGSIEVASAEGRIVAETMEGEITLNNLNSANIQAKSITGPITYSGTLNPAGIYNFHSGENKVDVTLPANSAFTLLATSVAGSIELGEFEVKGATPQQKRITGQIGGGGASLTLSTHRGQIRLRKR